MLDCCQLGGAYAVRVKSLRGIVKVLDGEIAMLDSRITNALNDHHGYHVIQQIPGVGRMLAAVFVAEIGDVSRFPSAPRLCSWAGMTPSHRESD